MDFSGLKLFKITNKTEEHNGYQFHDGLNVDPQEWSDKQCSAGGFYFTGITNIFGYLSYGTIMGYWVREVTVPENEELVSIEIGKSKAHSIILGERRKLSDLSTIKYLVESGADINIAFGKVLEWASEYGYLDIVKYLIDKGVIINNRWVNVSSAPPIIAAAWNGHLDIVKYLVEHGAQVDIYDSLPMRRARANGYLEVAEYLESIKK